MSAFRCCFIVVAAALGGCGKGSQPPPIQPGQQAESLDSLLTGIVTAVPPDTPETLEHKRIQLQSHLALAEEAAQRGELDQAIRLLEDAVMFDSKHRTVLLLLMQYSQTRSKALAEQDEARAYALMVKAGGYLRMLRDAHQDFSAREREIIASVLFDGACAYARAKRQADASASLVAAIEAGFDDLERLNTEPDFDEFRKDPQMAKLLAEAASTVQKRATERARKLPRE
jgi:hypothetical protein